MRYDVTLRGWVYLKIKAKNKREALQEALSLMNEVRLVGASDGLDYPIDFEPDDNDDPLNSVGIAD